MQGGNVDCLLGWTFDHLAAKVKEGWGGGGITQADKCNVNYADKGKLSDCDSALDAKLEQHRGNSGDF